MSPNQIIQNNSITFNPSSPLDAALFYASRGWPVFPLVPGTKFPPRGLSWPKAATTDSDQIRTWWENTPNANVAIATGGRSGLVVLDIDVKNDVDGVMSLAGIEDFEIDGFDLCASTPSGGFHIFYSIPPGMTIRNSVSKLAPGLDIRADGGYILAQPSQIDGRGYYFDWMSPKFPDQLSVLPRCIIDLLNRDVASNPPVNGVNLPYWIPPHIAPIINDRLRNIASAQPGRRNDTLNKNAFYLARYAKSGAISVSDLLNLLLVAALKAGLADQEALNTIQSALQRGLRG